MNEELLTKAIENGNVEMVRMLLEKNEKKEKTLSENKKVFEEEWRQILAEMNEANQDGAINGKIHYTYATLKSVRDVIKDAIKNTHITYHVNVETKISGDTTYVSAQVELTHSGNGYTKLLPAIIMPVPNNSKINTAQSIGSIMTYARRYALTSAFNIATEDNDANVDKDVTDNSMQDTVDQTHSILQKLAEENKLSELETAKWICKPLKLNPEESQGWSKRDWKSVLYHAKQAYAKNQLKEAN